MKNMKKSIVSPISPAEVWCYILTILLQIFIFRGEKVNYIVSPVKSFEKECYKISNNNIAANQMEH